MPGVARRGCSARNLLRSAFLGYVAMHLACLAVVFVGWSPVAVITAIVLYLLRMFAITGFYHRYFSHRAFQTSRAAQLASCRHVRHVSPDPPCVVPRSSSPR